jgi:hypothetical protein
VCGCACVCICVVCGVCVCVMYVCVWCVCLYVVCLCVSACVRARSRALQFEISGCTHISGMQNVSSHHF